MDLSDVELPSNRKFGLFFGAVFLLASAYFYFWGNGAVASYVFAALGAVFAAIALLKADLLAPLNRLWMRFGLLLGMIISPIVLGLVFFGLFTPVGLVTRLFGRDELRLRFESKRSHWIHRDPASAQENSFKNQF